VVYDFDNVLPANSLDAYFQTRTGKKRREGEKERRRKGELPRTGSAA
jgi:hypothetical protein